MKYLFILFILVHWPTLADQSLPSECVYSGSSSKFALNQCGQIDSENSLNIESEVLRGATYNKNGLAELTYGKKCFWFTRKGKNFQTPCLDQRPDPFSARFSRFISRDGKYGFMNWSLMPVIAAKWDYALPFQTTFAKVCNDCKIIDGTASEAERVKGGPWFIINLKGRVVKSCPQAQSSSDCQF